MTRLLLLFFTSLLFVRCANIVPPTGGPRDLEGPKIISSFPKNGTKNYRVPLITITCDELIEDNQLSSKIIVSPPIEGIYSVKIKKNTLQLSWKDTLKENTTYTFNFAEGIKDIKEGSTLKNFSVTFSTGSQIDSNRFTATIKPLPGESINPDFKVLLFNQTSDSLLSLLRKKPEYIGYLDSTQNINIGYVKENTYTAIAISDNNKNNKWDKSEPIDIKEVKIKNTVNDNFILQQTILDTTKLLSAISLNKNINFLFNKGLQKISIKDQSGTYLPTKINNRKYSIENEYKSTDTIKVQIEYVDSMGISGVFHKKVKFKTIDLQKDKDSLVNITAINNKRYLKPNIDSIQFTTDKKVDTIPFEISTSKNIKYSIINRYNNYTIIFKGQKENDTVQIHVPYKGCTSINNEFNKPYILKATTGEEKEYGNINFDVKTEASNYIIYFENSRGEIVYTRKNQTKNYIKNLEPGEYKLFVHVDTNNDGYFNGYDPVNNIPAEPVYYFKEKLVIRSNWDLEDIQMIF